MEDALDLNDQYRPQLDKETWDKFVGLKVRSPHAQGENIRGGLRGSRRSRGRGYLPRGLSYGLESADRSLREGSDRPAREDGDRRPFTEDDDSRPYRGRGRGGERGSGRGGERGADRGGERGAGRGGERWGYRGERGGYRGGERGVLRGERGGYRGGHRPRFTNSRRELFQGDSEGNQLSKLMNYGNSN